MKQGGATLQIFFIVLVVSLCSAAAAWVIVYAFRDEDAQTSKRVAVVKIEGMISRSEPIIKEIIKHRDDDKIKAVVLRINSPGGPISPTQEIYREVLKLKEKKPVVTSFGTLGASGGYYVACASDRILANEGTITGSISVIMQFANVRKLLDRVGVESTVIKRGRMKDMGSPLRDLTEEEKETLQEVVDSVYNQFIDVVAKARKQKKEALIELAQGQIYSGEQALRLGLIDGIGNLYDAIDEAAKLAHIEGKPKIIWPAEKRKTVLDLLVGGETAALLKNWVEGYFSLHYLADPVSLAYQVR